jgi:hypothetical protein
MLASAGGVMGFAYSASAMGGVDGIMKTSCPIAYGDLHLPLYALAHLVVVIIQILLEDRGDQV